MNRCKYTNSKDTFYLRFLSDHKNLKGNIFALIRNGEIPRTMAIFPKSDKIPDKYVAFYIKINKSDIAKDDKHLRFNFAEYFKSDRYIIALKKAFERQQEIFPNIKDIIEGLEIAEKYDVADPNPNSKEISEAKVKFDQYVENFLRNISSNPELLDTIKSLMLKFKTDSVYGVAYAGKNPVSIVAQKPNATFVMTRQKWFEYFNRIVNNNATKIVASYDTGEVSRTKAQDVYKTKANAMNAHQKSSIQFKNAGGTGGGKTGPYFVYDISDTTLIPGEEDTFNTQKGLSDNLRGIANKALMDAWKEVVEAEGSPENKAKLQKSIDMAKNSLSGIQIDPNLALKNINTKLGSSYQNIDDALKALIMNDNTIQRDYEKQERDVNICFLLIKLYCGFVNDAQTLQSIIDASHLTKRDLLNIHHVAQNACAVITSNMSEGKQIINEEIFPLQTMLNLMGIPVTSFQNTKSDEPVLSQNKIGEEKEKITESFYNLYNRLLND